MSRYIDADALIADLDKGLWGKDYDKALAEAIIQDAPSIDIDLAEDGTLSVEVEDATKVKRVLVEDGKNGDLYYADRPQDWIPCSERMPEEDGDYLVSLTFEWGNEIEMGWLLDGEWVNPNSHVTVAWMPLPEPWKVADDCDQLTYLPKGEDDEV